MFNAKVKSELLKGIIDVTSPLVNEVKFNITPKGISLRAVDPAHVAMVDLQVKDKAFEDHLFGGFFTAINSFISDKFSEGLDRAIFGEHTLLMNSIPPFLMCYVYKGQSYSAQQKIRYFLDKLTGNKETWQAFEKYYQKNQEIQLKDIPSLEPLINEVFRDKKVPINV